MVFNDAHGVVMANTLRDGGEVDMHFKRSLQIYRKDIYNSALHKKKKKET